jgi:hypothetical protein
MTDETNREPLMGKVAGIVNERELAINIGSDQGVKREMIFRIMSDSPAEVYDPDTQELLGKFEREKVRVEVVMVHKRFAICRTFRTRTIGGGFDFGLRSMMEPPRKVLETLKADDSSFIPPLPEEKSYVKKGDCAIQVI